MATVLRDKHKLWPEYCITLTFLSGGGKAPLETSASEDLLSANSC